MDNIHESVLQYENVVLIGHQNLDTHEGIYLIPSDRGYVPAVFTNPLDTTLFTTEDDFSEFVDWPVSEPRSPIATPAPPVRSVSSEHPIELPVEISRPIVVTAYSIDQYPKPTSSTTTSKSPSYHLPIQHYEIWTEPLQDIAHPTTLPDHMNGRGPGHKKRPSEEQSPGCSSFHPGAESYNPKRKKLSEEELDDSRRVRAHGACLRCYVQKRKCSEGRPCITCQEVFNRAYGSKTLEWRACVSSKLSEINIFTLGISLPGDGSPNEATWLDGSTILDARMASFLYEHGIELAAESGLLSDFDTIYTDVLQHTYGPRAAEVHPFILRERNPLYMLIRFNVVLLGSQVVGPRLIGYVRYLQLLRAACAIVAFERLERAFERNMLAKASLSRQLALIIQAALLLDQVLEMDADASTLATCFARGNHYQDMHEHLTEYVSYYLQKLISDVFGKNCPLIKELRNKKKRGSLGEAFWNSLASLIPMFSLGKPPKVHGFADRSFKRCAEEVNLERLYHNLYS